MNLNHKQCSYTSCSNQDHKKNNHAQEHKKLSWENPSQSREKPKQSFAIESREDPHTPQTLEHTRGCFYDQENLRLREVRTSALQVGVEIMITMKCVRVIHNGDQLLFIHDLAHQMDVSIGTIGPTSITQ
jgi:hypothetical protein